MVKIALPKLTFRLHDNSLLEGTDQMIVILEKERFPTDNYQESSKHHCWSYHQFNLLLQILLGLDSDTQGQLFTILEVPSGELSRVFGILGSTADQIVTDYITDPAFANFERFLETSLGDRVEHRATFTLLDWRQEPHLSQQQEYWSKATTYGKLTKMKSYILEQANLDPESYPIKTDREDWRLPVELEGYQVDLERLIKTTQQSMRELGMQPHCFHPDCKDLKATAPYEERFLKFVEEQVALVDSDTWYKPDTAIGIDFGWQIGVGTNGPKDLNTSQLSPFLSLGALSVRTFWSMIRTENASLGSVRDQLMWRECFHAAAIAGETLEVERVQHFWDNAHDNPFVKESDVTWKTDPELLRQWQSGTLTPNDSTALTEWFDANESMCQLWVNGWIHHLRRHLVADVLTRGKLGLDWRHGEAWFRHTLLDHDAAVNRANWMWLSAVAFSSKQKVYHYSPRDYVRRKSRNTETIQARSSDFFSNSEESPSRKWASNPELVHSTELETQSCIERYYSKPS